MAGGQAGFLVEYLIRSRSTAAVEYSQVYLGTANITCQDVVLLYVLFPAHDASCTSSWAEASSTNHCRRPCPGLTRAAGTPLDQDPG